MEIFPAFFPLAGRIVVVAGSGPAAEAKARLLAGSPARIVRLDGEAACDPRAYADAVLAFVASGDDGFAEAAAKAARAARVPVNVVDRPSLCDFTTPAVVDRGEIVAAVGTGGASPMLATLLRHDLEARIPEGAGRVAVLFRTMQDEVRAALPEPHARRAFLRAALTGAAAEAAMAGEMDRARVLLRQALRSGGPAHGRIDYVRGDLAAERLTLKASRTLAAADLLACDSGVEAEVLVLARRDADRVAPQDATPERLAELARQGFRVVRVTAGPPDQGEMRALAELGAEVGLLPVA